MSDPKKIRILKIIGFVCSAIIFLSLAITMYFFRDEPPKLDASIRDFFYDIRGKKYGFIYWLFKIITEFGNFGIILVVLGYALFKTKCDFRFFLIMFGAMLSVILVIGMKDIYSRSRPEYSLMWAKEDMKSFPSGHSAVAGFMYSFLIYVYYHTNHSNIQKRIFASTCVLVIILVMISRLVLGVHYFTDVIAGCAIGIMVSSLCMLLFRYCLNNDVLTTGLFEKNRG